MTPVEITPVEAADACDPYLLKGSFDAWRAAGLPAQRP
jgi:hypothetical protein